VAKQCQRSRLFPLRDLLYLDAREGDGPSTMRACTREASYA
jgi:hypothetical protein